MDSERNQQQFSEMSFEQRLLAELQQLVRPRHARWDELGLLAVRSFIREQLEACGPVELHTFEEGPDAGVNLILKLAGQNPELEPILVAAHYDGPLNSPGADDNATGVAALLELARRWSASPPQRPLWLVAFDKEEWGMLGSKALAEELREPGVPCSGVIPPAPPPRRSRGGPRTSGGWPSGWHCKGWAGPFPWFESYLNQTDHAQDLLCRS